MIENILIKSEASFAETGQSISNLKKINFFYGPNGSGKTTISRVIDNDEAYSECNMSWQAGNKLKTLVYNCDFVSRNYNSDEELKGVFTRKTKTLKGEDGNSGMLLELKTLENDFTY